MDQDLASDAAAVGAVLEGDTARFRELVERHQHRVYSAVYRMVRRKAEAEDLTQQAFIEGYAALRRYDPTRSFRTWLLRIAINNCKDYLKSHQRREEACVFDANASDALHAGHVDGPEQALQRSQRAGRIEQALDQLSETYRIPVVLRDVEGLSYAEMMEILDLPLTTLKIRVVRGRQQLQALLGDLRHD